MAQITVLQPLDFLKNSRSILNTNFANLNTALSALSSVAYQSQITSLSANINVLNAQVSALSAGSGNVNSTQISALSASISVLNDQVSALSANGNGVPSRNLNVVTLPPTLGNTNDILNLGATNILVGTLNPRLNGNITLSANNGYIRHYTEGPGTQFIDDIQGTISGGTWAEFYRVNGAAGIFNGTAYKIADAPSWPVLGQSTEGLLFYGTRSDSSLYFSSYPAYEQDVPAIYVPSVNNSNNGYKIEFLGNPGILAQQLTIGGQAPYAGTATSSAVNFNINTNLTTVYLSAAGALKATGDSIVIGTTHPNLNGNITLSANNGYTVIESTGPGLQIKDNVQQTIYGGTWTEFYRENGAAGIFNGTAYKIADAPSWPVTGQPTEGLLFYGTRNDSSIYISSSPGYAQNLPAIYVPSVNNGNSGYSIELLGPGGILTQQITIGGQAPYAGTVTSSATNLNITTDLTTVYLSAAGNIKTVASDIVIGTINPALNGNITLSANNGYTIIESTGPGLQIKDNVQQTTYGGSWVEFYRINGPAGIFNGTAYKIADAPNWPIAGNSNEGLQIYGTRNDSSISITSGPGYNNFTPGIYIPSINSANASAANVEITGANGLVARKMVIGNEPLYAPFTPLSGTSTNLAITYNDSTSTVYLSSVEPTTALRIGSVSAINFTNGTIIGPYAPVHSYGAPGDQAGTVAFDSSYIYYCTTNYVNNSTNIWRRVALSATTW